MNAYQTIYERYCVLFENPQRTIPASTSGNEEHADNSDFSGRAPPSP